ncbi:hypothetical protein F5Y14DRAFT_186584 [Nemania sp. NC0429]|nr:hypothetical protein F5Y14DRAFT_186584 [Nemania sp. NC0429]
MLSSISSIVGNKGQANHVAANSFLDAFSSYRLAHGLAAYTASLGVIQDVRYVAEEGGGLEARFDKRQWTPVDGKMLRRILNYSIFQQVGQPWNAQSRSQFITGLAYPPTAEGSDMADEQRFGFLSGAHAHGSDTIIDGDDTDASDQIAQAIKAFGVMHSSGAEPAALAKAALGLLTSQITKISASRLRWSPAGL